MLLRLFNVLFYLAAILFIIGVALIIIGDNGVFPIMIALVLAIPKAIHYIIKGRK